MSSSYYFVRPPNGAVEVKNCALINHFIRAILDEARAHIILELPIGIRTL